MPHVIAFSPGDRVRVRLRDGSTRLADVVSPTDDPTHYHLALDGYDQVRRVHVDRLILVRSVAQARAGQPAQRRRTAPPVVVYALAGVAVLLLVALGALLAGMH